MSEHIYDSVCMSTCAWVSLSVCACVGLYVPICESLCMSLCVGIHVFPYMGQLLSCNSLSLYTYHRTLSSSAQEALEP